MKPFLVIITCILTSLYYFPIQFPTLLPSINSKLILATLGSVLFFYDITTKCHITAINNFVKLSLFAGLVTFASLCSISINNTPDYSYAGYIFSMWVWVAAAYIIIKLIHYTHGFISFRLISNYLIVVCVLQCIFAIINDVSPSFKEWVDSYIDQGQDFINNLTGTKRKYGIGANLDTAGVRFSAVLISIVIVIYQLSDELKRKWLWFYSFAFIFITFEGNIISRTTIIGTILALLYTCLNFKHYKTQSLDFNRKVIFSSIVLLLIGIGLTTYLYHTNIDFQKDIRFGFEGFFSLVEKGEWIVSSNDRLQSMYIFPESTKTWLIGDGYFSNPRYTDPYFIGKITGGYYMGTDVGFLRFIYYFGLVGLLSFALFFIKCGQIYSSEYPKCKHYFWMIVMLNYIIWLKISTDLFCIFALFIAADTIRTSYNNCQTICE